MHPPGNTGTGAGAGVARQCGHNWSALELHRSIAEARPSSVPLQGGTAQRKARPRRGGRANGQIENDRQLADHVARLRAFACPTTRWPGSAGMVVPARVADAGAAAGTLSAEQLLGRLETYPRGRPHCGAERQRRAGRSRHSSGLALLASTHDELAVSLQGLLSALELFSRSGNRCEATTRHRLGNHHRLDRDYPAAQAYYDHALRLRVEEDASAVPQSPSARQQRWESTGFPAGWRPRSSADGRGLVAGQQQLLHLAECPAVATAGERPHRVEAIVGPGRRRPRRDGAEIGHDVRDRAVLPADQRGAEQLRDRAGEAGFIALLKLSFSGSASFPDNGVIVWPMRRCLPLLLSTANNEVGTRTLAPLVKNPASAPARCQPRTVSDELSLLHRRSRRRACRCLAASPRAE